MTERGVTCTRCDNRGVKHRDAPCERCGAPLAMHWQVAVTGRQDWTGCPYPPNYLRAPACGFLECTQTDDIDAVLGLCPEHLARAKQGLATRQW